MLLVCRVKDCTRPVRARDLCEAHYKRFLRDKEIDTPIEPRVKGGSGKYNQSYRKNAEKKLGRRLLPGEIVHHRDENRKNGDPDNLVVCPTQEHHFFLHKQARMKRLQEEIAKGTLWKKK